MIAFAFDRDWTVDVNPHPGHEAVPLAWVRHLAHETGHAVYAIGNQRLASEADIPGIPAIVERHPDDSEEWLGERQEDGRYERFPLRRERLALIADLHPDAEGYVVVDDIDLSDVDGWDHYHAWEFVPAVERGDIDPGLPWAREPVTDGGVDRDGATGPADHEELEAFLANHAGSPAFELTYTEDGEERTRLVREISVIRKTVARAVPPAAQCTPADPDAEAFGVTVDSIRALSPVGAGRDRPLRAGETAADRAATLARLVDADPELVRAAPVVALLRRDDPDSRRDALRALEGLAAARPADCVPAVPVLRSLLEGGVDEPGDAVRPLRVLRRVAEEAPAEIAPAAETLGRYVDVPLWAARHEATRAVAAVADRYPEDVVGAVPHLVRALELADGHQGYAVRALCRIAREFPGAVRPAAEVLGGVVLDGGLADGVRLSATAALGRVTKESPDAALDIVEEVLELLGTDNERLRANAAGLLADVAAVHTDVIEPHVDRVAGLLADDDPHARANATCVLARVAEDFPDAVADRVPALVDRLDDAEPVIRKRACRALGRLEAEAAAPPLWERARNDDDREVREQARWALTRIEGVGR